MVSGARLAGGAAGTAACGSDAACKPARYPDSHARCSAVVTEITRFSAAICSCGKRRAVGQQRSGRHSVSFSLRPGGVRSVPPVSTVMGSVCCQSASSGRSAIVGPNQDQRRGAGRNAGHRRAGGRQRANPHILVRAGRIADQRHRFIRRPSRLDQPFGDLADPPLRHVEHQHLGPARQRRPVHIRQVAAGIMPGRERHAARQPPVRQRDAGRRGAADPGADPRHDAERNTGGGERQRFLAAAAEHQRIAALQPHHAQSLRGQAGSAGR